MRKRGAMGNDVLSEKPPLVLKRRQQNIILMPWLKLLNPKFIYSFDIIWKSLVADSELLSW
jgi:hypothetical protein